MKARKWIKYDTKSSLWIKHRKRIYLYWFKFLQLAEDSDKHNVDWNKYRLWGGKNAVMSMKFDDWWKKYWKSCFGVEKQGDIAKHDTSSSRIKADGVRYNYYTVYYFHKYPHFKAYDVALKLYREVKRKRASNTSKRTLATFLVSLDDAERIKKAYSATDAKYTERFNSTDAKVEVQSRIGRCRSKGNKTLKNVCKGIYP